jgi:hypothetical protein
VEVYNNYYTLVKDHDFDLETENSGLAKVAFLVDVTWEDTGDFVEVFQQDSNTNFEVTQDSEGMEKVEEKTRIDSRMAMDSAKWEPYSPSLELAIYFRY